MTSSVTTIDNTDEKNTKTTNLHSWLNKKEDLSHEFIENKESFQRQIISIGEIYTCEIGENIGEEQCNRRPVLIVSKTFFNNSSSQVTVVPLSETIRMKTVTRQGKRKRRMSMQTHYRLKQSDFNFLNADSAVKCEQIKSISKSRLVTKLGKIDTTTLHRIKKRISILLDL